MAKAPVKKKKTVIQTKFHEDARQRRAEQSAGAREVGPLPEVVDPKRRKACEASFRTFCETYFYEAFYLGWSPDHLRLIAEMERTVIEGGLVAFAMPRGSGKTTITEKLAEWAILTGRRKFIVLIGATAEKGEEILDSIKSDFQHNELLSEDFPEVCYPIGRIEGESRRTTGQTLDGARTMIGWGAGKLVLPTVEGSICSGSIICSVGITGAVRGIKHATKKGQVLRPDFVIPDDPQTKESAFSPSQTMKRVSILNGDILGLAGPDTKIAGLMPCTVIAHGDMATQALDRDKCPEWHGFKAKMLPKFPDRIDLWEQYRILRDDDFRANRNENGDARQFYISNRALMDAGSIVGWESRKTPGDVSALQYAMHLLFRDRASFDAEYQNEPNAGEAATKYMKSGELATKMGSHGRGKPPGNAAHIVASVDVQGNALYWLIMAWETDFTGYVLDYGIFPEQNSRSLALADVKKGLKDAYPGRTQEGIITAGLTELLSIICAREFEAEDGATMRAKMVLVDSGWGPQTETVLDAIKAHPHAGSIFPYKGYAIGATKKAMGDWKKDKGDRTGLDWRIPKAKGRALRVVQAEVNAWKTRLFDRLATPIGDPGCVSLFTLPVGYRHEDFANQVCAETPKEVTSQGRTVVVWENERRQDNHEGDCMVMNMVGASILGCQPPVFSRRTEDGDKKQPEKRAIMAAREKTTDQAIGTTKIKRIRMPGCV